jgi:hypothetical protein
MRSKLLRLRSLVLRFRVDRRLPPQTLNLFRETRKLRRREAQEQRLARRRSVLGASDAGQNAPVARLGTGRVVVEGPISLSAFDLGHRNASAVVDALVSAEVEPTAVGRVGNGLEFGVRLPQRQAALRALAAGVVGRGWYLRWTDGSKSGLLVLGEAVGHRQVERARRWEVFRAYESAGLVVGAESATHISFWEVGASGHAERVGTRGHERFDVRSEPTVEEIDGLPYPGNKAFPVGANFEHVADPIDIVYTWVDGSDPKWVQSFRDTAAAAGRSIDETALDPARYRSRDELKYSLRSVWKYCGWVRTIWIVTAGQVPDWLRTDERVRIVDHSDILPADALPTFNSHAIESALHHINGLAEHFIYFNDDMAIGRPVRPELFFTPNGLARVFQSGARVEGAEDKESLAFDTGARRGRELLAERFGRVVSGKPYHAPYPLRRSTLQQMEAEFSEVVGKTAHSRFRSPTDLSIAASFGGHYGLGVADSVIGQIEAEYVHVESGRLQWHLDRIRLSRRFDTFCVNETHSGIGGAVDREQRIATFYEQMFPIAAPWEQK